MNTGGFNSKLKPEKVNWGISSIAHLFEGVKLAHTEEVRISFFHETGVLSAEQTQVSSETFDRQMLQVLTPWVTTEPFGELV